MSYQYKSGLAYRRPKEVKLGIDYGRLEATGNLAQSSYYIDYARPNKGYNRLDVGLTYRPVFKKLNLRGEFSISVINYIATK